MKYRRLKFGRCQAYDLSAVCLLGVDEKLWHDLLHKPALTEDFRTAYVNIIRRSKVTKRAW
jgi:hypothetical protein